MPILWPIRAPRRVRDTSLELLVTKLLRQHEPVPAAQIAAATHRIYDWFKPSGSLRHHVQRLLDVIDTIDAVKQEVVGFGQTSVLSNMLAISLARLSAVRAPVDESYLLELGQFVESLRLSERHGWLYLKVDSFYKSYVSHHVAARLIHQQMPPDDEAAEQLSELGIEDGEGAVAELASALAEHRAYGVKPCLFQDGILHSDDDAWVFTDGYDLIGDLPTGGGLTWAQPLAITLLAARSEIGQLEPTRVDRRGQNLAYVGFEFGFRSKLTANIGATGEFTTDSAIGAVSLRECFDQADRAEAYTLFRITHLLRLYNLIVPRYVMAELPILAWPVLPRTRRERKEHKQWLKAAWRDLVLPRLRILKDPAAIQLALQQELKNAESVTESRDRKPVARHKVAGFVRPLPAGATATDRARQLAWEQRGIILSEGETYVRFHKRGRLPNPAAGHRARVRD